MCIWREPGRVSCRPRLLKRFNSIFGLNDFNRKVKQNINKFRGSFKSELWYFYAISYVRHGIENSI